MVASLAAAHVRSGHEVHLGLILGPEEGVPTVFHAAVDAGAAAHELRVPARAYGRERRLVRGLCALVRPHVVHTHGYRSDVVRAASSVWIRR